jgi:hypothetical protein
VYTHTLTCRPGPGSRHSSAGTPQSCTPLSA